MTLSSIGGTLKQLFRLYGVEIFALLYIGKLTPEFGSNGKLEIPLFHKELVGSTCGSSRKTALLDENQGRLSKKSLLRFTLTAAPRSIPVDKLGVVALRMATETQPEAFDRELELIKSVPQLRREVGNGRLVCINEQKDKVGSTAQDKEGKPDVSCCMIMITFFLNILLRFLTLLPAKQSWRSLCHHLSTPSTLP